METGKTELKAISFQQLAVTNCQPKPDYCINRIGTNVTDVGVWDKTLNLDAMVSWTSCR